jgi:hypothetical protein
MSRKGCAMCHDDLEPIGENPWEEEWHMSGGKGATCPTEIVPCVKVTQGS